MRSLHRLCESEYAGLDTSEIDDWLDAAHAPAFRSNAESVIVVVGYGSPALPMDWLYAYDFTPQPGWDRDWLLDRVEAVIPRAGGKPVAHSIDIRQIYSWDVSAFTCHWITLRHTDPLIRRELRSTAVDQIERLFLDLQDLEDVEMSAATRPPMVAYGVALAFEHLKADQLLADPPPDQSPTSSSVISTSRGAVHIASPAFAEVAGTVSVWL